MIKINGSNVTIMVKDMNKSISFYESIGLTLKDRWGDNYAMVQAEGVTIGIHPGGDPEKNGTSGKNKADHISIGFMIDKFAEAKALLEKNKIQFEAHDDGKSGNYLNF